MNSYRIPSVNCSWKDILSFVTLVEDPIYSTPVDIEVYQDMYGQILDSLDGLDEESKVSFFFEISHVNQSTLVFRNDKSRLFFREEAEELNLIPKLVEVCEGESIEEKMKRTQSEKALKDLQKQTKIRKIKSDTEIKNKPINTSKMIDSARQQLEKLNLQSSQLNKMGDDLSVSKKNKIDEKIVRIKALIEKNKN